MPPDTPRNWFSQLEKFFAMEVQKVLACARSRDYEELLAELEALEVHAVARAASDAEAREYRRRIAEALWHVAHMKARPVAECERFLCRRSDLGYTSLYEEVLQVASHARYCVVAGEKRDAFELITMLLRKIDDARGRGDGFPDQTELMLRELLAQTSNGDS